MPTLKISIWYPNLLLTDWTQKEYQQAVTDASKKMRNYLTYKAEPVFH